MFKLKVLRRLLIVLYLVRVAYLLYNVFVDWVKFCDHENKFANSGFRERWTTLNNS